MSLQPKKLVPGGVIPVMFLLLVACSSAGSGSGNGNIGTGSTLINLDLAVQNTSDKAIMSQLTFFQSMGPEGDTFGYQYNSSDNFYGIITAHATRSGTIVFQVPTASTSSLRLLYRPEIATETAIILLKIS